MKLKLYLLFLLAAVCLRAMPQDNGNYITGRISIGDSNRPLSGATVTLKKQRTTTTSKPDGSFSLLHQGSADTLLITFVGFESKTISLSKADPGFLHVQLQPAGRLLDEVNLTVSTGYQTLSKARATGSFVSIDQKLYNEQVGTNVLERLKYISNGVAPMSNRIAPNENNMLIRGLSTLNFNIQSPLIILDNFEYQGDIANLNPNDVENVTFLKDAAAGSIWGAKAANGVIVITTKKGKYNQKTRISFNSNLTLTDKPDLYYLPEMASSDFIDVERFLFEHQYRFSDTASARHPAFSPAYEILFAEKNGKLTSAQANMQLQNLAAHDIRDDFSKYLYQQGINQQYSLNLNGGSSDLAWTISAGLDRNEGTLRENFQRINLRAGNMYRPLKNLEISADLSFTRSTTKSGAPGYGSINTNYGALPQYTSIADKDGNALPVYHQYRAGYIDELGGGKLLDWRYYPLDDYTQTPTKSGLQDLNAVLGLNYKVGKVFNFDVKYRYEKQSVDRNTLYTKDSYYARNLINSFTQLTGNTAIYKIPKGGILDLGTSEITAQNLRGQLNAAHDWDNHEINFLIGAEVSETGNSGNTARSYGYNPAILTTVNVDLANSYPNFITGNSFIPNPVSFSRTNTRFLSFYGNAAYTYRNQYTLSASARRDASNVFGVDANDKWKPLWSVGAAWNISKAAFYPFDFLPLLKFRLTYGSQGNVDPSKVGVFTLRYDNTSPFTLTPRASITNYVNPDLKWEQVNMVNAAMEFGLQSNRISGSIEYYKKFITDMYGPSAIDVTTGLGVNTIVKNIGEMKGQGFDIQLNTINTMGKFRWTSSLIFNTYTDKVTKYYSTSAFSPGQLVGNSGSIEGNPSAFLAVYKWAGLDPASGDPQGYLNGAISKDWVAITGTGSTQQDIRYVGRRIPPVYGSVGNALNWKGWSLSVRLTYKFGYYFLRNSINYNALTRTLNGHADYAYRWQQLGDENTTSVPSMIYPANAARSSFYEKAEPLVEKGDHVRLQYINMSYTLDRAKFKRLPFASIQIYGVANNIGIIWKKTNADIDPDFDNIPPSTNYAFGLKLNY